MKRFILLFSAILALVVLPACSPVVIAGSSAAGAGGLGALAWTLFKDAVPIILEAAGKEGILLGLQQAAPAQAPAIAADVQTDCADILSYLNGGTLPTADVINQIVTAKLGNLPPFLLQGLQAVSATLSRYVPAAAVVLTPQEIGYLQDFFQGVAAGAQDFAQGDAQLTLKYSTATGKAKAPGALWFAKR